MSAIQWTGSIELSGAVGDPATQRAIQLQTNGSTRWRIRPNTNVETGSNVGSDLAIDAIADDGSTQLFQIFVKRSTGDVTLPAGLSVPGSVTVRSASGANGSSIVVNPQFAVTIANNAVLDLSSDFQYGKLIILITSDNGQIAEYLLRAGFSPDQIVNNGALYTGTPGTASKVNIYYSSGAWHIENKTGVSATFRIFTVKLYN